MKAGRLWELLKSGKGEDAKARDLSCASILVRSALDYLRDLVCRGVRRGKRDEGAKLSRY